MSILITIIVLSIMKLAYTIGQFIALKRLKLPVDKFVIGIDWGKPIFQKQFDDTELIIYPVFWGGYLEKADVTDKKQARYINFSAWFAMLISIVLMSLLSLNYISTDVLSAIIEHFNNRTPFNPKAFGHNCISMITMILLISVLILVHEAGHFLAARMFKIKVERFGFGLPFGPTLWQKQCGDTLLIVHAFLLGGYVAFPDDNKENGLDKDSPDRFGNKPIYQRFIVISAGVLANVLCAVFIVFFTAIIWGKLPTEEYVTFIKDIPVKNNISLINSGLQAGDKIVDINGSPVDLQWTFQVYAIKSRAYDGRISQDTADKNLSELKKLNKISNDNEIIKEGTKIRLPKPVQEEPLSFTRDMLRGFEKITDNKFDLTDTQKYLRDELVNDKRYYTASYKKVYTANGATSLKDIAYALSDNACPVNITVERNGKIIKLAPVFSDKTGIMGVELEKKRIYKETKGIVSAFKNSNEYLTTQTYLLLKGLWQLVSGKIPFDNMHGVVAIVKYGGDVIQNDGIFHGLLLTALISLDLAIVNFLPIPALDGGHAVFLIIEKICGRKLDEDALNTIATVGFVFLILLMIAVIYNDIVALFLHKI